MSADESITNLSDAVAALGALPVPVGPEPNPVDVADHREQAEAWEGHILGAWDGEFRMESGLDRAVLKLARMVKADVAELMALRARVAELEAERHTTNEALDDAVQELRAIEAPGGTYPPALPWAALMDDEDLEEFLADLTASIVGHDGAAALAEIERTCSTWRLVAEAQHGHNTAPGPDAVTRVFSPVASLREPEGEHYAAVHHSYRLGHDLPETGGTQ